MILELIVYFVWGLVTYLGLLKLYENRWKISERCEVCQQKLGHEFYVLDSKAMHVKCLSFKDAVKDKTRKFNRIS